MKIRRMTMATFKKYENQVTKQVPVASVPSGGLKVGDLFTYTPASKAIAKITKASEVTTALGTGLEVYLVAQGDMLTYNEATGYKEYKISDTVSAGSNKIVVAYPVLNATNIDGFAAESNGGGA